VSGVSGSVCGGQGRVSLRARERETRRQRR